MLTDSTEGLVPPIQIGAVVKNIEETAKLLSSIWGIGPWDTKELTYTKETLVEGEPFKIKVSYAELGGVNWSSFNRSRGNQSFQSF